MTSCKLCDAPLPAGTAVRGERIPLCHPCHQRWVLAYANLHQDANGKRSGDRPVTPAEVTDAATHRQAGDTVRLDGRGGWEWVPPQVA